MFKKILLFVILLFTISFGQRPIIITPGSNIQNELDYAPGDAEIIFLDGTYDNVSFTVNDNGRYLSANNPGKVFFTGNSNIIINANNVTIEGFVFKDIRWNVTNPSNATPVILVNHADNCRITECSFIRCGYLYAPGGGQWAKGIIHMANSVDNIEIDRCYWVNSKANSINVEWRPEYGSTNLTPHIHHNYFSNITFGATVNGNEAILLGRTYQNSEFTNMDATIEYNLFENCNADSEIISNKTSRNIIRFNTFTQSLSSPQDPGLNIRYGNNCSVYNNVFLNTRTGIVIHGDNHKVYNNYIEGAKVGIRLPGYEDNGGINAVHPNSTGCYIVNNTIINAETGMRIGAAGYTLPNSNNFYNNLIHYNPVRNTPDIKYFSEGVVGACNNQNFEKNYVTTEYPDNSGSYYTTGITYVRWNHLNMNTNGSDGLYRLSANSNAINNGYNLGIPFVSKDLDLETRDSNNRDIGADEYSPYTDHLIPLSSNNVGPIYYNAPSLSKKTVESKEFIINEFLLNSNYPNPFNPTTKISYQLPKANHVSIKVFNSLGQEVKELVNELKTEGSYNVTFNASNLPSGVYFYTIQAGEFTDTKKMLLVK